MKDEYMYPRCVIIPTHDRHIELQQLVCKLRTHVDIICIIDNASCPAVTIDDFTQTYDTTRDVCVVRIIRDEEQPPNLYRFWNVGFDTIAEHATSCGWKHWDVIVLNDDVDFDIEWLHIVTHGLREHNVAAASTGWIGHVASDHVVRQISERGHMQRMCPWAFVVAGERGLRADERFRWWYGDNDFDWQARQHGGVLLTIGPFVINKYANQSTVGALAEQAARDGSMFVEKWGIAP